MTKNELVLFSAMNAAIEHAGCLMADIDVIDGIEQGHDESDLMLLLSNFVRNKKRRLNCMANSFCGESQEDEFDDDAADDDSDDLLCDDCDYCPDFDDELTDDDDCCDCDNCKESRLENIGPDALMALLNKLTRIQKDLSEFDELIGDNDK